MSESSELSRIDTSGTADPRPLTSLASHRPTTTISDDPLPTGKYYPSNYETQNTSNKQSTQVYSVAQLQQTARLESSVPKQRLDPSQSRLDSDAKRRLHQYQRGMVTQAQLAASEILEGSTSHLNFRPGTSVVGPIPEGGLGLVGSTVRSHKPASPRLLPLGSPGPVTPIDLESGDSYLSRGEIVSSPEFSRDRDEAAAMMRAEEERRAIEGVSPPVPTH